MKEKTNGYENIYRKELSMKVIFINDLTHCRAMERWKYGRFVRFHSSRPRACRAWTKKVTK